MPLVSQQAAANLLAASAHSVVNALAH